MIGAIFAGCFVDREAYNIDNKQPFRRLGVDGEFKSEKTIEKDAS